MDNKEYLNEEQYQKTKKKLNTIGTILLIVGIPLTVGGMISQVIDTKDLSKVTILLTVFGLFMTIAGVGLKITSKGREITAFQVQQQMPIVQESAEKMAPTTGKVAKEITKGIKEGLKD